VYWVACLLAVPATSDVLRAQTPNPPQTAAVRQDATVRVWVNTSSGVYHCPGTKYFGATGRGKYLSEEDARSQGYRPAYGKTCGTLTPQDPAPPSGGRAGIADLPPSGSSAKVWVNTKSRVYHCAGTKYYGATKSGRYMSEADARDAGYRPAYGKRCG
jgi:hypothetical protein